MGDVFVTQHADLQNCDAQDATSSLSESVTNSDTEEEPEDGGNGDSEEEEEEEPGLEVAIGEGAVKASGTAIVLLL